jgi:hypothetical protein
MFKTEVATAILFAVKSLEDAVSQRWTVLPPTCEAFLELNEDRTACGYYFVDHASFGLFWLDEISTEILDLWPVLSEEHLGEWFVLRCRIPAEHYVYSLFAT